MFRKQPISSGFTLIELMLAMAFFTFILVFIVTVLTSILATYNKGLTVKDTNQSGRTIALEMQRSIRSASPAFVDTTKINQGRLCTGAYSYAWSNDNTTISPTTNISNQFDDGTTILFARIYDPGSIICTTVGNIPAAGATNLKSKTTELISDRLRIRSLQIYQSSSDNPGLFTIRFVITAKDPTTLSTDITKQGSLTESDFTCTATDRVIDQFCASNLFVAYAYAKN